MQKLLAKFVPVADEVGRLRWARGPEGELFRKIPAQKGYYLARKTKDRLPVQGTYALTPSGLLLGSVNANTDPRPVIALLENALSQWRKLSAKQRLPAGKLSRRPSQVLEVGSGREAGYLSLFLFPWLDSVQMVLDRPPGVGQDEESPNGLGQPEDHADQGQGAQEDGKERQRKKPQQ